MVWRMGAERREFLADRASRAEAFRKAFVQRSPVVAVGRALSWEKFVATAWRFEVFGDRFSEKRRASEMLSVIVSRNCFLDLFMLT